MLNPLNEVLRDDFINEPIAGVGRWNRVIERAGYDFRLQVPHKAFHRKIGPLSATHVSPEGQLISEAAWKSREADWLPTTQDRAFVASLIGRVVEPGKFASWIAPPARGINNQPVNFEYIRFT